MTDVQHEHVQRDLAAMQAAEKKFKAAVERVEFAKTLATDAERAFGHARARFHETVHASSGNTVNQSTGLRY